MTEAVGPSRPHTPQPRKEGSLVVYTALDITGDPVQSDFPTHSSYKILDQSGKTIRRVDNRNGSFYQSPATVSLPPGNYQVKGEATNAGEVIVPVVIEVNKTTVVDLEGSTLPQRKPTGERRWVRLPDGQVIGARTN